MRKLSATAALATITILLAPAVTIAQTTGTGHSASGMTSSQTASPPSGTNSAGTAQSSGGPNSGEGVTVGAATTSKTTESADKAIAEENKTVDRRVQGICRGC